MQVDYDRNAAKRTNVIDDQSDFFEIDSNAWLSDEVRGALQLSHLLPDHVTDSVSWPGLSASLCFSCHPDCNGFVTESCGRAVSALEQERAQLKERERAMQEAEQARKRAVRVTIDLLGRQV